jgi:biotin carboxyl carrier protein
MNIPNLNYKRQLSTQVIVQKQVNIAAVPSQTRSFPSASGTPAAQQVSRSIPSSGGLLNSPMVGRIYRAKPGCGSCGK